MPWHQLAEDVTIARQGQWLKQVQGDDQDSIISSSWPLMEHLEEDQQPAFYYSHWPALTGGQKYGF